MAVGAPGARIGVPRLLHGFEFSDDDDDDDDDEDEEEEEEEEA